VGGSHRCVKFVVRPFARRIRAAASPRASTGVTQLARKRLRPGQFARNTRKRLRPGSLRATRASGILRAGVGVRAVCAQHAHRNFARKKACVVRRLCTQDMRRQIARNDVYPWVARSCSRSSGCAQPFPSSDCAQLLRPQIARNRSRSSDCAQNPHAQSARSRRQTHALGARCRRVPIARRISAGIGRRRWRQPSARGLANRSTDRLISQPVRSVDNP
jgi:hypothetical protein